MRVDEFAGQLGMDTCFEFDAEVLVPEETIRGFCLENKCGKYGANYMCPPYVGALEEIKDELKKFPRGILLRCTTTVDVSGERETVTRTKVDFHKKILQMEEFLKEKGIRQVWGMSGGSCGLCETCNAKTGEPCRYPDQARMSIEAIGVNILGLLDKFGMDNKFHPDKVTWTGCVLLQGAPDKPIAQL